MQETPEQCRGLRQMVLWKCRQQHQQELGATLLLRCSTLAVKRKPDLMATLAVLQASVCKL